MEKKTHIRFLLPMGILLFAGLLLYVLYPVCRFTAQVLVLCAGIVAGFYLLSLLKNRKAGRLLLWIYGICVGLGLLTAAGTGVAIICAGAAKPPAELSYVIVLGARVREDGASTSLQERIDGAYAYLSENPDTTAVLTGGQGTDEPESEAACMYRALTGRGISADRLIQEDKAESTMENLQFSMEKIRSREGGEPGQVGIVSSPYHLLRAQMFARRLGIDSVGIPSPTANVPVSVNFFLREIVAVWYYLIFNRYD